MNFVRDKVSLGKRSRWIAGAEEFARLLSNVLGVAKVKGMDSHTSHVASGKREPKLKPLANSVQVTYFAGGRAQLIYVFPEHAINATTLQERLVRALTKNNHKDKVGQSSKDEILIPEHIRRRMIMDAINATKPVTAAIISPVPEPTQEPIQLTGRQAEAYEFILSLAPDQQTDEFTLTRLTGRLTERFGSPGGNYYERLKSLGLVIPGMPTKKQREGKISKIYRRPFTVKSSLPIRKKQPTRLRPEHRTRQLPAASVEVPPSILERIAAIEQQVAYFHRLGLTVELIKGKVNLRKT